MRVPAIGFSTTSMSSIKKDAFEKNTAPDGDNKQRGRGCGCSLLALMAFACGAMTVVSLMVMLGSTNRGVRLKSKIAETIGLDSKVQIVEKEKIVEVPVDKIVEKIVLKEPPLPDRFVSWKKTDTAELWNQIRVLSSVDSKEGEIASVERTNPESYNIELKINISVPKASDSISDLKKLNPELPKMLPGLERMVKNAKVSPFYHQLYENKIRRTQENVTRLDRILTRHNFFDCETVLELTHPDTGQKVMMIQGEMDVVTDGSDGDRWPELDEYISMSTHYSPTTSYAWKKTTQVPNPLMKSWREEYEKLSEEFKIKGLSMERNRYLRDRIAELKIGIDEMKFRSFLIAEADPFVVIPLSFLGRKDDNAFAPQIGDMCAVIYENKIYPAIAGDAGPTFKSGEASLRIAKELNEEASPYSRPVSDLKVTYLVFPDTREKPHYAPDLKKWHTQVSALLDGIGGLGDGYVLHEWADLIAKKQAEAAAKAAAEALVVPPVDTPAEPTATNGPTAVPSVKGTSQPRAVTPVE